MLLYLLLRILSRYLLDKGYALNSKYPVGASVCLDAILGAVDYAYCSILLLGQRLAALTSGCAWYSVGGAGSCLLVVVAVHGSHVAVGCCA